MRFGKPGDGRRRERTPSPKKPPRPGAVRERVLILVLTLVLMLLYFSVQRLADDGTLPRALGITVMVLYMVSFGGLLIAYLIYNRAFIHKDVTVDMLPEDWPEEKKQAFVDGNRRRAERSRWLLLLLIPFVFVFLAEAMYLFLWLDNIENWFK